MSSLFCDTNAERGMVVLVDFQDDYYYILGMRTINTALCAIHKEIPFPTLYMPSLMRDFFLNALTPIQNNISYIMSY